MKSVYRVLRVNLLEGGKGGRGEGGGGIVSDIRILCLLHQILGAKFKACTLFRYRQVQPSLLWIIYNYYVGERLK